MSSYYRDTINPKTGEIEEAFWRDDYFGNHKYGVQFGDGKIYKPDQIPKEEGVMYSMDDLHEMDRDLEWGTYGKNPDWEDVKMKRVTIRHMSNLHILNILEDHLEGKQPLANDYKMAFIREIKFRSKEGYVLED